jgi:hypothetical protein
MSQSRSLEGLTEGPSAIKLTFSFSPKGVLKLMVELTNTRVIFLKKIVS